MKETDRLTAEGILFTDEYRLTMAQLYYRMRLQDMHAQFDHLFRSCPNYGTHQAGYHNIIEDYRYFFGAQCR